MAIQTVEKMAPVEGRREFVIGNSDEDEQKSNVIMHVGYQKDKAAIDFEYINLGLYKKPATKEERKMIANIVKKVKSKKHDIDPAKMMKLSDEEWESLTTDKLIDPSQKGEVKKLKDKIYLMEIMLARPIIDGIEWTTEMLRNLPTIHSDYILLQLHNASMEMNSRTRIDDSKKKSVNS